MDGQTSHIIVGAAASLTRVVEATDVEAFAQLTGDQNPVHLDEEYASQSRFGARIAHGALIAGYISAVLGTMLPGPGSIYLEQTSSFKAPVYIGDEITATVRVIKIREDKPIVTLETSCVNQHGKAVIEGTAVLLCPQLSQ